MQAITLVVFMAFAALWLGEHSAPLPRVVRARVHRSRGGVSLTIAAGDEPFSAGGGDRSSRVGRPPRAARGRPRDGERGGDRR
jgi:hypothetical protein